MAGWSDEDTALAREDDAPLISFDEDEIPRTGYSHRDEVDDRRTNGAVGGPTPSDKLKMLLRRMDMEIRTTTPAVRRTYEMEEQEQETEEEYDDHVETKEPEHFVTGWRAGRRTGLARPETHIAEMEAGEQEEEREDPPTPPIRAVNNPYLARMSSSSESESNSM